jgi:hypothetical protein
MTSQVDVQSPSATWTQQAELPDPPPQSFDLFGYAVAISGNTALVGAPAKNNTGAVYVFVQSGTTWTQQGELTPSDGAPGDLIGYYDSSLAISGNTALVGASGGAGAAYVFVRVGTTWTQQAKLTPSGGVAEDTFGWSVALSQNTALVGAPGPVFGAFGVVGAAYVFVRSGTSWTQEAELTPSDSAPDDAFGNSVALSDETAVVGAPYAGGRGAAYVFVRRGATWTQQDELVDPAPAVVGDNFGWSVAVSEDTVLVGAFLKNSDTGAAYVFGRHGMVWVQQAELDDPAPAVIGDDFGWSVAVSEGTALVGDIGKNNSSGVGYVFTRNGTRWSQQAELDDPDPATSGDVFGFSIGLSGTTAVISAMQRNSFAGTAYVFVRN